MNLSDESIRTIQIIVYGVMHLGSTVAVGAAVYWLCRLVSVSDLSTGLAVGIFGTNWFMSTRREKDFP